ncbi:DUF4893 domain-containing protein [Paracoccus sp. (in: a-proteobacteria)]|uniref:DUF4893 domain-containing protein n=1 Tax=Paracoccus sp. TaxID=267 RepID=UPI00289E5FBC|nr:DUF4893 domain-containing protein [Paracoccus sp. (in: a-proteobacteria)]
MFRRQRTSRFAALCLMISSATLALTGPVRASERLQDGTQIRSDDVRRLASLDLSYGTALRQAFNDGDNETVFALIAALRGAPEAPQDVKTDELVGQWQCNMTKVGGNLPGVIYPPYRCEIRQEDGKLVFEKQTGSQLTRGTLHRDGDRIVYLGTDYIRGSNPPAYHELPDQIDTRTGEQFFPDAGVFEVMSKTHARIILPQPHLESEMNVLNLTR